MTALADTNIAISNTQVSGLGTMSTQNANAVSITLGANLDVSSYSIIGGNFGGNQLALPVGFGPFLQGLYEGNVNLRAGTTGVASSGFTLNAAGALGLGTSPSYGSAGQVLTSGGSSATATWSTPTTGTVTSVSGAGTVNGLTLTGTVTTSGSLTLGGTLDLSSPPAIGGTLPAAITGTTITATNYVGISGGTF